MGGISELARMAITLHSITPGALGLFQPFYPLYTPHTSHHYC